MSSKNENAQTQNTSASFFKELGQFMIPYKLKYISSVLISIIGVVLGNENTFAEFLNMDFTPCGI